jgi:polyisoprenoid-binding protein YceI
MHRVIYSGLLVLGLLFSAMAEAALPVWKIVPNESSIQFTITENGSPVKGSFKTFTGDIEADPQQLAESHIKIIVDMNSVSASYAEIASTLKTPEWFNVKLFPQAVFTSNKLTKVGNNTYQAAGQLTIRNKTVPVTLSFTLEQYAEHQAKVKGSTVLKRTDFGLATGEWAKTDALKDEVKVDFVLAAER